MNQPLSTRLTTIAMLLSLLFGMFAISLVQHCHVDGDLIHHHHDGHVHSHHIHQSEHQHKLPELITHTHMRWNLWTKLLWSTELKPYSTQSEAHNNKKVAYDYPVLISPTDYAITTIIRIQFRTPLLSKVTLPLFETISCIHSESNFNLGVDRDAPPSPPPDLFITS